MKHIFKNRQGETIVEVLVSFLLLMIFTSMFVVSLRYARAMSQKAETLRRQPMSSAQSYTGLMTKSRNGTMTARRRI